MIKTTMASERRAQWGSVLNGAIIFTAMAILARDWAKTRQGEELIAMASGRAGIDSALLTAIFGGEVPAVDLSDRLMADCFDAGKTASDAKVAQAREVVRVNKATRESAKIARQEAERSERASVAAKARAEATAVRMTEAEQEGLLVGAIVSVKWTYKQARRDVATTEGGVIVECHGRLPGCGEGSGQARVKKVGGRLPVVELI